MCLRLALVGHDGVAGEEAVFEAVLGGAGFALGGARAGGFFRVFAIGLALFVCGHWLVLSLKVKSRAVWSALLTWLRWSIAGAVVLTAWKVYEANEGAAVTITPPNGLVQAGSGSPSLARGVMAGYVASSGRGLGSDTQALLADFQNSNPGLAPLRGQHRTTAMHGQAAESILMAGQSPVDNQSELVWVVTTLRPNSLFYIAFVAPESEYNGLRTRYEEMLRTVAFY